MAKKVKNFNKSLSKIKKVNDSLLEIKEKDQIGITEIDNPSPSDIINELKKSTCTVFFYKTTNGVMRRMTCTLNGHSPIPNKYNRNGVIVVWDVEANGWRSFYPERVFKLVRNEQTDMQ